MRFVVILTMIVLAACVQDDAPAPPAGDQNAASCEETRVRELVEQLGVRMRNVPLLAPDSLVRTALRDQYGDIVSSELLEEWLAEPSGAPGRATSSPWPARIEVASVRADNGRCVVTGSVEEVTSTDTLAAISRTPVTLTVDGDRITRIERSAQAPADSTGPALPDDARAASDVVRRYYAAIAARDYATAWGLWSDGGAASGQSLEEFTSGFASTADVRVEIGEVGRIEGAAGSRFVEVPVIVQARTDDGTEQRFEGTYTLRRSVVDGATEAQRSWRIHSASIARTDEEGS